ncbi:MAG: hypothetical protein AUG49_13535 [Catenulispora sp. 13_1_20CM_3_70_7]|nr:MAG: hypothetical protein AUG49_13535 [Catenulispora sp. 13_1_20CM_3_70_7]
MNDMRKLLSGALPAPGDEPQPRDVIGAAMEWGERRRRRDWTLTGATALAVLMVGAGVAVMGGGSNAGISPTAGPKAPSASGSPLGSIGQHPNWPGVVWNSSCNDPTEYCRLLTEVQNFTNDFAKGSVPYLQAALPQGYSVKATGSYVVILTGPGGTNYLYPSVTSASTLDGHTPSCRPGPSCYQTSAAGGKAVVAGGPSDWQSAGWVKDDLKDPRITITVGTVTEGGIDGVPAPTAHGLLSSEQLAKLISDPHLRDFATTQYQHQADITKRLQAMVPPSESGSPLPGGSSSGSPSWTTTTKSASGSKSSDSSPPGVPLGGAHS